jgi:hypothetical protein
VALRAKKPEAVKKRLKLFLYGKAGVGKTTAAIQLPSPYIIDTERGTEQEGYVKLINASKGAVLQTQSADDLIQELKSLLSEPHDFRTVVIDPITNIEDNIIAASSAKYESDKKEGGDMRVWRDRDRTNRRISSLILALDMNVVVTAHGKIQYGENFAKLGTTYEGWKKWDYLFDLVLELTKEGKKRFGTVVKSRLEAFPDGDRFEWSYEELAKRYGNDILERKAEVTHLATTEQVAEINRLLGVVKVDEDWAEKVFQKAGAECWADMPSEKIGKCIDSLSKKLNGGKEE